MKKLAAFLLAALMLCALLAGCDSTSGSNPGGNSLFTTAPTTQATPNPEYEEIFTSNNIVDMPALFLMMDSVAMATIDSDGMIEKLEFGYKDDIIHEMVDTIYFPMGEISDDEKSALDEAMKEAYTPYTDLSFCTSTFNIGNSYYTIKLEFSDLDNADNVLALQNLDMLTGDEATGLISMEVTETNLLAQGYIKR